MSPPIIRPSERGVDWMAAEEVTVAGDWAVQRPDLAPAGWAFEFANDFYADVDDTAEVVLALHRIGDPALEPAIQRGVDWVVGMQSADGGWAAFDADNTHYFINKLPFCDFGAVIDPPSADVTAHAVEMLAVRGLADSVPAQRGVAWLLERAGARRLVVRTLGRELRLRPRRRACPRSSRRASSGPHCRSSEPCAGCTSTRTPTAAGARTCAPTTTRAGPGAERRRRRRPAWALMALLAAGDSSAAVEAGVTYLIDNQQADGGWDEDLYTGTGFPGDFYINYELYRHVFPLTALGRYLKRDANG